MSREIALTKGRVAIVDDEDYEWLSQWKWYFSSRYAMRSIWGKSSPILMHREIMRPSIGFVVDHINRDSLDNRRRNLRVATQSQNMANSVCGRKFKGVFKQSRHESWFARITVRDTDIYLGNYKTQIEAAMAYDQAAIKYFGEFARPNFGDIG